MKGMIYLIHDGRPHSALCFVAAPVDFGTWFNEIYRPWAAGAGGHPVAIVGVAPKVDWREDPLGLGLGAPQPRRFSTLSVIEFLRSDAIIQRRDGVPRPGYRLEPFRITGKRIRVRADSRTARSVEQIAKIAGAGPACIPRWFGDRVLFEQSKKLPGLLGSADCCDGWVSLLLHNLTVGEAASALQTLVFIRGERRKRGKR
jgi:hypothetical protein